MQNSFDDKVETDKNEFENFPILLSSWNSSVSEKMHKNLSVSRGSCTKADKLGWFLFMKTSS